MNITKSLARDLGAIERMKTKAVKGLMRTLKAIETEKRNRVKDLDDAAAKIHRELAGLGVGNGMARSTPRKTRGATKGTGKARRPRRSPEQIKREALAVWGMIQKAGADGIGGGDIRKAHAGVGQDIKGFVESHTEHKVKTKGKKRAMTYHAS
jgi:hypothetical protein